MKNNYDNAAEFYDVLSKAVFRRSIIEAQVGLLTYIPAGSTILIVGGGTGWILEEIGKVHATGLDITYVEISEKMLKLSRKRDVQQNKVQFVHAAIEVFVPDHLYDIVITAFLFDNFSSDTAKKVFNVLHPLLKQDGHWLFADFTNTPGLWQRLLLKSMYTFFRLLCKVEATQLHDMQPLFDQHHYQQLADKRYYGRFIRSAVYRKTKY